MGLEEFARDMLTVCNKHGYYIRGCGCCGSPFVRKMENDDDLGAENIVAENFNVSPTYAEIDIPDEYGLHRFFKED